jgi:hypothetical protein
MRTSDLSPRASGPLAGIALLALVLSGCGRTAAPVAPAAERVPESALRAELAGAGGLAQGGQSANLFYPLDLGNHWGYEHDLSVYVIPDGGPPGPAFGLSDRRDRDLVCIEQLAGRSYVVERESYPGGLFSWVRYRQDGAGLYEADINISLPPACARARATGRQKFEAEGVATLPGEAAWAGVEAKLADPAQQVAYRAAWERVQARASAIRQALWTGPGIPRAAAGGGVEPGEITRLEYPLHPGAHWVIRADPRFESIVEGAEVLDLAAGHVPGWRIRIETDLLGPNDRIHIWFGCSGLLKLAAHLEGVATDPGGNPIGRVISEESEVLTELSLGTGRFAAR